MRLYTDRFLPHLVHWMLRGGTFRQLRQECVRGLSGTVLEVGFGSGLNLPWYPREVTRLWFLEPSPEARRMAREAIAAAPFPVEPLGDTAESIPLAEASVDAVVSTWTLCTIPDVETALREMRRVLRPGGQFRFVEHGRSPEPRVARWQDRLTPLQKRLAGGCHLNRPIDRLIEGAGFRLDRIDRFYVRGPKIGTYLYAGVASSPKPNARSAD
jgi:ubiquinone/menaquinone biosynthesis C-methylase UbiE